MLTMGMNDEEAKFLLNVLERYNSHLEIEIIRTHHREFREALKERDNILKTLIDRLKKLMG
ncbi:MAG: hypothetical protein C0399_00410 [Syntrophus sp. (in: bacteria)]|nr:hypothetical protein [Syntrophus sp. (in: bacteria)]